jgi:hypothetical protein
MNAARKAFVDHVHSLEARAIAGDEDATKSLACMALLAEGFPEPDPDGGVVIDLMPFLKLAA